MIGASATSGTVRTSIAHRHGRRLDALGQHHAGGEHDRGRQTGDEADAGVEEGLPAAGRGRRQRFCGGVVVGEEAGRRRPAGWRTTRSLTSDRLEQHHPERPASSRCTKTKLSSGRTATRRQRRSSRRPPSPRGRPRGRAARSGRRRGPETSAQAMPSDHARAVSRLFWLRISDGPTPISRCRSKYSPSKRSEERRRGGDLQRGEQRGQGRDQPDPEELLQPACRRTPATTSRVASGRPSGSRAPRRPRW